MRYFAIILLLATATFGANDFTLDDNCVALWRFENGALATDSKGTNTLVAGGAPTADTSDYQEGSASVEMGLVDYYLITDGNLDAGFPLKDGDTNKKISMCTWVYVTAADQIFYKWGGDGKRSLYLDTGEGKFRFSLAYNATQTVTLVKTASWISGRWYHIGLTYQDSDKSWRLRIRDKTTAGLLGGVEYTGTSSQNIYISDGNFEIGRAVGTAIKFDEYVVFKDILSAVEIDAIYEGRYFAAEATAGYYALDGNLDEVVVWNDALTVTEIDSVRNGEYDDSTNYSILDVTTRFSGFTGSDDDFFSFTNWLGVGYFTNNVDQIFTYSGSGTVAPFNIQVDGAGELNHVQTCRYIFVKNDRLLLLDVVEHGNWIPQRCRFSPVLSTDFSIAGGGYVDAPTEHRIVSAGWVGKDIVVFFRGKYSGSLWKLRTTGNTDLPFRWDKISDTLSSQAPYAAVEFNDGIAVIGLNNIIFYDGFRVQYLDLANIRDIVDDFDQSKLKYSTALHAVEDQHVYFTYTTLGESYPNRMLDYNILEQSWSVHKYDVHVLGTFDDQDVPIWTDIDIVYTGIDGDLISSMTFDVRDILGDPFPFTLMGTRASTIYKLNTGNYDGTNDSDGTIDIDIQSSRWNPFIAQNQQAALGKMLFLVDNDEDASFTVSYYKDMRTTAWTTRDLSCDSADDGADKFWITTNLNGEVANFHRIKISHDERNNRPRIHAIMPFFQPGGELKFE